MSDNTQITCDNCGADLTTTGNCEDYRLVLASQSKMPWYVAAGERGGAVTAMAIPDPMPRATHFCDLSCLRTWVEEAGVRPTPSSPAA